MRAILYVDRSVLYYAGGDAKAPITLPVAPLVVQDMEIIDEEALNKLISEFLATNKLKPSSLLICVSNACYFSKELPEKTEKPAIDEIKKEFDDTIPFNKVLSAVFRQGGKSKIIGINRELVYVLKNAFEHHGFKTEAIVPVFALYGDQATTFSPTVATQFLKHFSSLQQVSYPLVTDESTVSELEDKEFSGKKKKPQNRQTLLIGVFVFLILILIMVYMLAQRKKQSAQQVIQITPTELSPTAAVSPISPTDSPTTEPTVPKDQIVIRVLNGSGTPGEADRVKERLSEAEFTNIVTGNAPTQISENASIIFKPTVPREYRDEIATMIKSLGFEVSIRENNEIDQEVLITTYQSP